MLQKLLILTTVTSCLGACSTTGLLHSTPRLFENETQADPVLVGTYSLPRVLHTVTVKFPACSPEEAKAKKCQLPDLSIGEKTTVIPDLAHVYQLRSEMSAYSSNTLTVETDPIGFLKSVEVNAKDETAAVIGQLAELAKAGASASVALPSFFKASFIRFADVGIPAVSSDTTGGYPEVAFTATLDFSRSQIDDVAAFESQLNAIAGRYTPPLRFGLQVTRPDLSKIDSVSNDGSRSRMCSVGVCYRPLLPYGLALVAKHDANKEPTTLAPHSWILLPNDSPLLSIDLHRTAFVERKGKLTFTEGVLTKVEVTKPSEALAVATLPVTVLKTLVSIPGELLTLRINQTTSEKSLLDAQTALAKAIAAAKTPN